MTSNFLHKSSSWKRLTRNCKTNWSKRSLLYEKLRSDQMFRHFVVYLRRMQCLKIIIKYKDMRLFSHTRYTRLVYIYILLHRLCFFISNPPIIMTRNSHSAVFTSMRRIPNTYRLWRHVFIFVFRHEHLRRSNPVPAKKESGTC